MSEWLWPWASQTFNQYPWLVTASFALAAILLSFLTWMRGKNNK